MVDLALVKSRLKNVWCRAPFFFIVIFQCSKFQVLTLKGFVVMAQTFLGWRIERFLKMWLGHWRFNVKSFRLIADSCNLQIFIEMKNSNTLYQENLKNATRSRDHVLLYWKLGLNRYLNKYLWQRWITYTFG